LYTRLCMYTQRKKSIGVESRGRGGQVIGPPRPIYLVAKVSSKHSRMTWVKCAGVPSCWIHIHDGLPKTALPAAWVRSLGEMLGKCHQ
jgi:hypothetical protein